MEPITERDNQSYNGTTASGSSGNSGINSVASGNSDIFQGSVAPTSTTIASSSTNQNSGPNYQSPAPSNSVSVFDCLFVAPSNISAVTSSSSLGHGGHSIPHSITSTNNNPAVMFTPPTGFAFVEEKLCRAFTPIKHSMFAMLDSVNVGTIINVSGESLDTQTMDFLSESNIRLVSLSMPSIAFGCDVTMYSCSIIYS
jgi:hypothetical protein